MRQPCTRGQPHFSTYHPIYENVGLFYFGYGENTGVWATDGTTDGTYRITYNLTNPNDGHIAGGNFFFSAGDDVYGEELRVIRNFTDFTSTPSYTLYTEEEMDPITFEEGEGNSSNPAFYVSMGDILFFAADDGTHGHELWRTDGTEEGTYMVKDICTQYVGCDGIHSSLLSLSLIHI